MLAELADSLREELVSLESRHRLRSCPHNEGPSRVQVQIGGRRAVSFSSNDYLGLATHSSLASAAADAALRSGFGASASRLISGDFPEHRELETALASFLDCPSVLTFPTGYQANLGVLTALAGTEDLIVSDAANHASIIDGCRLSRARVIVYPHLDFTAAATALGAPAAASYRRRFLVTESVFSMDGDVAPLGELQQLATDTRTALIVDEAHALGALGPGGRGLCHQAGVHPDVLLGTLGKAFGTMGGFVAGSPDLRTLLVNRARSFLFTTSPPPPLVAATRAALALAAAPEGDARRERLRTNIAALVAALPSPFQRPLQCTPILPIILGSEKSAVAASSRLLESGLFVQAIRPPTVPTGTARLRVTVSADHLPHQIHHLAATLHDLLL